MKAFFFFPFFQEQPSKRQLESADNITKKEPFEYSPSLLSTVANTINRARPRKQRLLALIMTNKTAAQQNIEQEQDIRDAERCSCRKTRRRNAFSVFYAF